jgi:hypothetical protein
MKMADDKCLIENFLPIEAISKGALREKSVREIENRGSLFVPIYLPPIYSKG